MKKSFLLIFDTYNDVCRAGYCLPSCTMAHTLLWTSVSTLPVPVPTASLLRTSSPSSCASYSFLLLYQEGQHILCFE